MDIIEHIAGFLNSQGPWAVVAFLGFGYWKVVNRKDAELLDLHRETLAVIVDHTAATGKLETALDRLTDELRAKG